MLTMVEKLDMRELRSRAKLSRQAVITALGISSTTTIQNWETGLNAPSLSPDQTTRLCKLYGCTLAELVDAVKLSMEKRAQGGADPSSI